MRFGKVPLVLALTVAAAALATRPSAQAPAAVPFVAGEVLVRFRPGVAAAARTDAHRAGGGTPLVEIPRTGVQRIRVRGGDESAAIARYARNPNVLYAEPNAIRHIPTPLSHGAGQVVPGDRRFDEQWALHNTGQSFYCFPWFGGELCAYAGTPDADVDAPEAWGITDGDAGVTVAVIDSGIDYTHPDLAPNYAGGDDFIFNDGDPMDDHGHGTHVAGIIAAAMDNPTGIPGQPEGVVGAAPHARILAYKVCRSDGTCSDFAIQQAIARAIADGAHVINMSLGQTAYSQSLDDAVQDAWHAGLLIVAGAGNNGSTQRFYPAALDNVISVAAFDEDHRRPSFSNYGSWVDISAPGNAVMSTYPMARCATSSTPGDTGCYAWLTGTSMATPYVSGAAALVWSRSDVATNAQVAGILLDSADPQGVSTERLDGWTTRGGLNLHAAISYGLTNLPPDADAGVDQTVADEDGDGTALVTLDGRASSDPDGTIVGYEWREDGMPVANGPTPAVWLAVGTHTVTLEVTDDAGDSATDAVTVTVTRANQVTVAASTPQAAEAGPVNGVFTLTRTGPTDSSLTVQYALGGAATAGVDYLSLPSSITIPAGSAAATVTVTPVDDTAFESEESVVLTLSPDDAYSLGPAAQATVTIVSDDLPPDLVVTAMTAPAVGGANGDIVVSDTTKNQGAGPSVGSATGFYLSANASLDASDVLLGSRAVPALAPAAAHTLSTTLRIPSGTPTRTYFVLAAADLDASIAESNDTNNVRASGWIRIGPDLIVSALTGPWTAAAGGPISISSTTKNQGGGASHSSTTRFYLSTNTILDASDVVLGSRSIAALAGGASSTGSTSLTLPVTTATGSYYVIAQADAAGATPETIETNNTRASSTIKVGPDLLVVTVSAPAAAAAGATITVSDTTKNQGRGSAPASSTAFYLSSNSSYNSTDVFLGSRAVGPLNPSATSTASISLTIPSGTAAGSYYVIAVADWDTKVAETSEINNIRASYAVRIGPDLTVISVSAPSSASAGGSFTASDTTRNQGGAVAPASLTIYYLSTNTSLDWSDVFLGSRPVPSLGVGASHSGSATLAVPASTAAGTYYVIARADGGLSIAEALETNNTRVRSISITVAP